MISNHFHLQKNITPQTNKFNASSNALYFKGNDSQPKTDEFTTKTVAVEKKKCSLGVLIAKIMALATMLLGLLGFHLTRKHETKTIFQPNNEVFKPLEANLKNKVECCQITTADNINLNCWYVPPKEDKPTVLFCHGRFSNITLKQNIINYVTEKGMGIFLLEYRGYGSNAGTPSEVGFYKDADAAVKHLNTIGTKNNDIVVWGHSLGGGVAAELGSKHKFKGIILESTFSNITDMIKHCCSDDFTEDKTSFQKMASMLGSLVPKTTSTILKSNFRTDEKVTQIESPLLILHSKKDKIVPCEMSKKIAANNPNAQLYISKVGGHNKHYWGKERILHFIENLPKLEAE